MDNSQKRLGDVYKDLPVGQVVTLFMNHPVASWPDGGLTMVDGFLYEVKIMSGGFAEPRKISDISQMVADSTTKATIKYTGIKFEGYDPIPKGQMHYWSVLIMDMDETQYRLSK